MIKLIASDVDGTILQNGAAKPSKEQFALIEQCVEGGIKFVIASGRQYPNLRRLFLPVVDKVSFVAENGSLVMEHDQPVFTSEIPRDIGTALITDILNEPDCEVMLSTPMCTYFATMDPEFTQYLIFELKNTNAYVSNLFTVEEPWIKISAYVHHHAAAQKAAIFRERWSGQLHVAQAGPEWVDFGCASKGTALRFLSEKLGIQKEEMLAFGDNFNDVHMFSAVGTSYSMKSASPELQTYSTHTTETVEEVLKEILNSL